MTTRDYPLNYKGQQSLIAALSVGNGFPQTTCNVKLIETHISWVLIAGEYAYKIKKALDLGFLDFTSLAARKVYCEEEIRLNKRLAEEIYLDVIPIGGSLSQPQVNSQPAIEYAVRMRGFKQENLLVCMLEQGNVFAEHISNLAVSMAKFHASLPRADDATVYATPELIHESLTQNFEQLFGLLADHSERDLRGELRIATEIEFDLCKDEIQTRHAQGFTRECHGDLHMGNIVLIDAHLVPFDGIEFNPALRWIDVLDEVAFLVMDLLQAQRADMAFRFLNAYLEETGDYVGVSVLRFYIVYRAQIRAKIYALRASQLNEFSSIQKQAVEACHNYLLCAASNLKQQPLSLIITHGLPGSGKTTISQVALERFKAVRIRSDVERKRLFGLPPLPDGSRGKVIEMYSADISKRTYLKLLDLARKILMAGYSVIVDASFLKQTDREQFQQLAKELKVPFAIMSVTASDISLESRILSRQNKANGHGKCITPDDETCHDRFPHLNPLPKGEEANESLREFFHPDASEADIGVMKRLKKTQEILQPHELVRTVMFLNEHDGFQTDTTSWKSMGELLMRT